MPEKYGAITETTKVLKLPKKTNERIIGRGGDRINGRGKNQKKIQFSKIDKFWKNLIRQAIYEFYRKMFAPTLDIFLCKLQEILVGTDYEFP